MAKIRLKFDRLESYVLLAATEYLRQLVSEDGGIPLIQSISPLSSSTSYTTMQFTFAFNGANYRLDIKVQAVDLWPKQGVAHLIRRGLMGAETGVVRHDFELRGNPGEPQVVFTRLRGGS